MNLSDLFRKWNKSRKWRRRAHRLEQRRQRLLSFGQHTVGLLAQTEQGLFAVNPEDDFVSRKLLQHGSYSEGELDFARKLTPPDGAVLVVGTHIGALAIPLAKHCARMVAIEANPDTFRFLEMNLRLNDCKNVTAYNLAAAEEKGSIQFLLSRDNSGGAKRMPKIMSESYMYDAPKIIDIPAERLDSLIENKNFDLVFMDIEGSEYFALKGMPEILAEARSLVVEFIPHHLHNIAGIEPEQFIALLQPHFAWMYIPKYHCLIRHEDIAVKTRSMYDAGEFHDGIVFLKDPLPAWIIESSR